MARRRCSRTASFAASGERARSIPPARASSIDGRRRSPRASLAAAVLLVPVAARAPALGVGRDMLVLAGLLALARFAVAAAAWDVANGFSLMGASRDLTIAVSTEATLVLALAVGALVAGTTSLTGMVAGTAGHGCVVEPGARARRRCLRARHRRRDRTTADRQPRHAPRADDDPRGAAARVRRARPRVSAVGRRGSPLARARAGGADLPAARPERLGAARRSSARTRRRLCRRSR